MTDNSLFDLVNTITGSKIAGELTREEKYYYLTKYYFPKDQNSLFKKQYIKGEKTKQLTYQLSWIQNKPWHACSQELRGSLCKVCVLFDQNSGSKPRDKFAKTVFQDVRKSEKKKKHKTKEYHKDALGKARDFLES